MASQSQLSWSSKVVSSMTFNISESEQTIPVKEAITEKEMAVTEDIATKTPFRSMSAAEVSQDELNSKENVDESVVAVEPEDLVNENKSEQEEDNKKEGLLEEDTEKPDAPQGRQEEDMMQAEHAQEELKTNRDEEEMTDKPLEEDRLENEKTTAEESRTETEMSKEPLEDDQQDRDKEQEPEEHHIESLKSEGDPIQNLKTSAGSKELEEEEMAVSTVDAKVVPEEPTMGKTMSFISEKDMDPVLNEKVKCFPTKELKTGDILGPVESEVTAFPDKEQTTKKVKSRKVLIV
ncbi:nestin-like [Puntigrus tetrazona]|uniref:nestin-like n=1 Tax=Puntigrus tetrazona TaxID=1606681 RepID=UPI001C8AA621|nr:nestin-like [Puntigrus tetrazona]